MPEQPGAPVLDADEKETIATVAYAVSKPVDVDTLIDNLTQSKDPRDVLRQILAIHWVQGFNVGSL
ncbi:hypothetical protein [Streptomyces sp. x-80]|uniref:hypothetical protein n=1 Tax=Streptomyces sp. x-80 TaxID=2789282 RepID=UPI003980B44F